MNASYKKYPKNGYGARGGKKKTTNGLRGKQTVLGRIVSLMKRPRGVTRREVLEEIGWPSISMQQIAEKARVELDVDDRRRPFIYHAK